MFLNLDFSLATIFSHNEPFPRVTFFMVSLVLSVRRLLLRLSFCLRWDVFYVVLLTLSRWLFLLDKRTSFVFSITVLVLVLLLALFALLSCAFVLVLCPNNDRLKIYPFHPWRSKLSRIRWFLRNNFHTSRNPLA